MNENEIGTIVVDASALYEPPFSDRHAGGPDQLFAGKGSRLV